MNGRVEISGSRTLVATALAASMLLIGAVAGATPVTGSVRFDGVDGFGTAQQTALDSGIPIVPIDSLDLAEDLVVFQDFDNGSVSVGPPATATSDWDVQNQSGVDLAELFLVFAKPLANTITVNGQTEIVDYAADDVGLGLQNDVGGFDWIIFEVPAGGDLYYYPAVSLGSLGDDQTTASPFQVDYILDNPQIFLEVNGFELGIPKWQILAVFVPVPEPSTALLVATGVAALAAGRRRRS
jgi:hypothetical protein